jgi:hypothetical protein
MELETAAILVVLVMAVIPALLAWFWPRGMLWVAGVAAVLAGAVLVITQMEGRPEEQPGELFGAGWDYDLRIIFCTYVLVVATVAALVAAVRRTMHHRRDAQTRAARAGGRADRGVHDGREHAAGAG